MSSMPTNPTSEPPIVGMSRSAAELVFWLRQSEREIVHLMTEISERHQSLLSIINNLGIEERTAFEAELPGLVHRVLELHDVYMSDQQKVTMAQSASGVRMVVDRPQA